MTSEKMDSPGPENMSPENMSHEKIGWFPGHMHKAQKELKEILKYLDVIIEVADARAPFASLNPLLRKLCADKPIITLWNKSDLCDLHFLKQILGKKLNTTEKAMPYLLGEARMRKVIAPLIALAKAEAPHRGTPLKPLRMGVVGIPNVGKSTLINTLVGRKIARVGDAPAITKGLQKINLSPEIQLIDSPGIMMPSAESRQNMFFLAGIGCIGENAIDEVLVVQELLPYFMAHYSMALKSRYRLETLPQDPLELFEKIAKQVGAFRAGKIYWEQASEKFLRDMRSGALGKICFYDSLAGF
jgi:ribosome biogenesis GTPase A